MSKKPFLYLSLILTIVSMVFLLLSYLGFIRYIRMHTDSKEKYLDNYKNLPKADKKDKVVVCFALDEKKDIKPFINSILDQTTRVDDIVLTTRDRDRYPELEKIVSYHTYKKDYGDNANLICSILREPESSTKIILVEPNIVYGQDFIEHMVGVSDTNKDSIIKHKNAMLIKPAFFDNKICNYKKGETDWLKKCTNSNTIKDNYFGNFKSL